MECRNPEYVARLVKHIHLLQQILQEWTPYVPHEVLLKHQPSIKSILPNIASTTRRLPGENLSSTSSNRLRQEDDNCSSSKPPQPKKEAWRQSLDGFIQKIPLANEWARKTGKLNQRIGVQASGVTVSRPSVLDSLLGYDSLSTQSKSSIPANQLQMSGIRQTLESYSARVRERNANAEWHKRVASYEKFVLAALAHVVSFKNVEPKFVDKMMEHVSDSRSSHQLRDLRRGVSWAVQATSCLHERGWDLRSGDIMFYFPPIFKSLKIWGKSKGSLDTFIMTLSTKEYTQTEGSLEMNQLHMPCILKCILQRNILLSDICKCLNSNFDIARKIFFDWYFQPYGANAMDDDEARALCIPMIRPLPRDDVPGDRGQKRRRTSPETDSPLTSGRPTPETRIIRDISTSETSLSNHGRITSYIGEPSMGSRQHQPPNTDFWSVVEGRATDGASSHDQSARPINIIPDGNTRPQDSLTPCVLEEIQSMPDPNFAAPSMVDDINWSSEPRIFVPDPGDPVSDGNNATDDPIALLVDDINWAAEPRIFVPTGSCDLFNNRNDANVADDPMALLVDDISWSAEPRVFVPTDPGDIRHDIPDHHMDKSLTHPTDTITTSGGSQNIDSMHMDGYPEYPHVTSIPNVPNDPIFVTPRQSVGAALEA